MFRRKRSSSDLNRTPSSSRPPEPRNEPAEPQLSRNPQPAAPHRLPPAPPARPDVTPRRPVDIPGHPRRSAYATATYGSSTGGEEGKKLIVGRDISLSGNIAACDKLVVEGTVEADVSDARIIEVAETGTFKGNAELDEADISGRFHGGLTVRQELRVRSTGQVQGTIRYARLVVEGGGRITGTVEVLEPEEKAEAQEPEEPSRPAQHGPSETTGRSDSE